MYTLSILGYFYVVFVVFLQSVTCQYLITLNETQVATLYCYSNFLSNIRIVATECLDSDCANSTLDIHPCRPGSIRKKACLKCIDTCNVNTELKNKRCKAIPGEYSTCIPITSTSTSQRSLTCVGLTESDGILTVNTSIIQHLANNTCYSRQDSPGAHRERRSDLVDAEEEKKEVIDVSYRTELHCVKESGVLSLDAGHLLNTGYTLPDLEEKEDKHELEHEEDKPQFQPFCQVEVVELWRFKEGKKLLCNGTTRRLVDEFPCLRFTPFTNGIRLPSLENCSEIEMVGIVIGMIIGMFLCYVVLLFIAQVWSIFCKCRHRKDEIEDPSTISRPPTQFSSKSVALTVVKQESRDSILSQKNSIHTTNTETQMPAIPGTETQMPVVPGTENETQTADPSTKPL